MNLWTWVIWQIASYEIPSWLYFVGITFGASRFLGWRGLPVGWFLVASVLYFLDLRWIRSEMRAPGWDGAPDMDFIFMFGLVGRMILINVVLLPVSALGVWLRRRSTATS